MPAHPHDSRRRVRLVNAFRRHVPPLPDPTSAPRSPKRLEVFAVGVDWVQLTWSRLGPGPIEIRTTARREHIDADGGPGAVRLSGLPTGAPVSIHVTGPGVDTRLETATLTHPGGELLHRIATVSDVHIGSLATGYFHTITEIPRPAVPHPTRCLQAALDEASEWGADELVVKGDLVDRSDDDLWETAAEVLAGVDLPCSLTSGNHEWSIEGDGDPVAAASRVGHELRRGVWSGDRPGLRLVLAETVVPGFDRGRLHDVQDDVADVVSTADTPSLVLLHHQPMRSPVPTYLPPGVYGRQVGAFYRALAATGKLVLTSSGHTHRHRRHQIAGVTATEVGSTKDFPGTWAGYEVYEGGIVQTVQRIGEPSCIRWTDWTRRAAAGVWQHWSPGRLADRCFTLS